MIVDILFIVLGLLGLFYGADWLVKGAARLASSFGLPALVIGLTVVAYGTSMPEMVVSLTAASRGSSDISVGNVVGSNIFNIALILGVTGFVFPIKVHAQLIRREIPFMIAVSVFTFLLAYNGNVERLEGIILFAGVLIFTGGSYWLATREKKEIQDEAEEFAEVEDLIDGKFNRLVEFGRVVVGIIVLMVAARLTIDGATNIAEAVGISEVVIGLTLVAAGTSLPELATSLVAAFRKENDISVGNIVGSNIFNLLSILGLTAIVKPIGVADVIIWYDFPIMIAIAVLLFPFVLSRSMGKREAAIFLAIYIAYTIFLFVR